MSLLGYFVLGIIIVIAFVIYVRIVSTYLGASKSYVEANRVNAIVKEDLGDMKMATGGITIGVPRYRVFHKYKVSFWLEETEYLEEAELKNRKLKVGDSVEIRYYISDKGKLEVKSEAFLCWIKEMTVGYTLGIILGIVLSILKIKGVI